jgi:thiol-disulfide isomerase/thioredoxin
VTGVVLALVVGVIVATAANTTKPAAVPGQAAPDGSFTTTSGTTETISALRGQPTLVWFVATWCSSCQAGTQAMAQQIPKFAAHHVRVVELEMANDLGQSGPPIAEFGQQLAGPAYNNPDWTFGTASSSLTQKYNPHGYLDIYYLFDAQGRVAYVNGSPGATMGPLLAAVAKVGSRT